jgi:LuxR family maltose regulon positive regulatory protein
VLRAVHSFKIGDLGRAQRSARRVLAFEDDDASFSRTVGYVVLGITHSWQDRPLDALPALEQAERLARATGNDLAASYALGYRAKICVELGDLEAAEQFADDALTVSDDPGFSEHFVTMMGHIARGRVLLRRGDLERADADLTRAVELSHRRAGAIEVACALLDLARTRVLLGDSIEAQELVRQARRAIEGCADAGTITNSVQRAERAMRGETSAARAGTVAPELTDRELSVLRLLESELSQREIGEALYVSLNTVKTHTRGIYRKLDATTRGEAVGRAHELGLL